MHYEEEKLLTELLMTNVTLHQDRITEDTGHCIGLTTDQISLLALLYCCYHCYHCCANAPLSLSQGKG